MYSTKVVVFLIFLSTSVAGNQQKLTANGDNLGMITNKLKWSNVKEIGKLHLFGNGSNPATEQVAPVENINEVTNRRMKLFQIMKAVADKDANSMMLLVRGMASERWVKYSVACMSKFHSKQLCFSNSVSFYIWQRMEVDRMRKHMLGHLWDIYQKLGYQRFLNFIG